MSENDSSAKTEKIWCADCKHCMQYREVQEATGRYLLKVKCSKGHWRRGKTGGACDLYRILNQRKQKCRDYVSVSENEQDRRLYLRDLARALPVERVYYDRSGKAINVRERDT